jgi:hypothetical protein
LSNQCLFFACYCFVIIVIRKDCASHKGSHSTICLIWQHSILVMFQTIIFAAGFGITKYIAFVVN